MVSQQELQEKQKALVESEQKMQMLGNQVATLEARAAGYNKEGKRYCVLILFVLFFFWKKKKQTNKKSDQC